MAGKSGRPYDNQALPLDSLADMDKQVLNPDIIQHNAHASPAEQEAADRETDPGPGVADRAHGDLAADAAAHLERSGYTLQSLGGDPEAIESEAACLIIWARAKSLVLADEYTVHLFRHNSTTAELWHAATMSVPELLAHLDAAIAQMPPFET